jgi:RNA-directed DNA polymerase
MLEPGRCGGTHARQAGTSRHRDHPRHAPGVSYHAESSERGKATYKGTAVTEVRSPHRQLLPDTGGSDHQKPTSLQGLANTAQTDKQHRFRDLYGCLDADRLLDCGSDLNKQAASGVDGRTAQAYEVNLQATITAWAQRLKGKRYRATLVRRCDIPKETGSERPLGIPAREDTLVQRACAKLLTAI